MGGGLLYYQRAALAQKKPSGLKLLKLLSCRARCPPPRHPPFAAANIRVSLASLLGRVQAPPHPLALRTGLACAPPGEHRRWTRATGQCARPRDALPDPGPGRRPELRKTASCLTSAPHLSVQAR